jgi:hypothetical protein
MWLWIATAGNWVRKHANFSVSALLKEQLSLSQARVSQLDRENAELKAKVASLEAEIKLSKQAYDQQNAAYEILKDEHEEEVVIWQAVEYRRSKRTLGEWAAFCPKCHMPLHATVGRTMACSGCCGWVTGETESTIVETLEWLEKISQPSHKRENLTKRTRIPSKYC